MTRGEEIKLETILQCTILNIEDLSCSNTEDLTQIHGFHNIQSEICQNTKEI